MITGVVLARNEEANIVDCLRTLQPHVAEILLIDMKSSDRTVELARPYVSRVLTHPLVRQFDSARNIAIPAARYDWIWFIDADERVPERTGQLVNELIRTQGDTFEALVIPFKSYFCGKWIEHCGWWPGYTMPRVLKRGHFRYADRIHGGVDVTGRQLRFPPSPELAIEHFSYRSIEHYLEKFNRYTTTEAHQLAATEASLDWRQAFRSMMHDLWFCYEQRQGARDGQHGWILSWLSGQYRWTSVAKLLDLQEAPATTPASRDIPEDLDEILAVLTDELERLRSRHPMRPLGIVWRSPIWDASGYAEDARTILTSLSAGDLPVTLEEIRWSERNCSLPTDTVGMLKAAGRARRPKHAVAITACIPTLCRPDPKAGINVLRTTFETDRIPPNWLPLLDAYDEVWVWSQFNRRAFCRSGVEPEKIRVVPGFIDTRRFSPDGPRLPLPAVFEGRFVFLSVFDWQLRKGWDLLLQAYCREFRPQDGVGLMLKITRQHGHSLEDVHHQMQQALDGLAQTLQDRPDIVVWDDALTGDQMAALYRSVGAFVGPSRGEGWGRAFQEAMASGLATIGTHASGNLDFMDESNSILLPARPVAVQEAAAAEIPVFYGHCWYEPDLTALQAAMRRVYEEVDLRDDIGRRAVESVRARFDVAHAAPAVQSALQDVERRFLPTVAPSIQSDQVAVVLEGELFAGHSFSNINEKLAAGWSQDARLALSIDRQMLAPQVSGKRYLQGSLAGLIDRPLARPPQVTVRHAFPPNWARPSAGKWVHIQPWEFGYLPQDWVAPLRDQVDEIWVMSQAVRDCYLRSGIPAEKIHVIPWGVDPDVFRPDAPDRHLPDERFYFLFVGGTIRRKGFDLVWEAYLGEFSEGDHVGLIVKDMGSTSYYATDNHRDAIRSHVAGGTAPPVIYVEQEMSEGQLAGLYAACDCLVAPYRGEGFGLPILEAMACGLTPIIPRGGASDDFTSDNTAEYLPAQLAECRHSWQLCGTPTELQVRVEDLRAAMRTAYEQADRIRAKGREASARVRQRFTWEACTRTMAERICCLARQCEPTVSAGAAMPEADLAPSQPAEQGTLSQRVSACLLVDETVDDLDECLGRLAPFVDEVVVGVTASQGDDAAVAREYGARIVSVSDDQSPLERRNAILDSATSGWILWLEPDEWLDDVETRDLRSRLIELPEDVCAAYIALRHDEHRGTCETAPDWAVRLFRNTPDLRFSLEGCNDLRPGLRTPTRQIHPPLLQARVHGPSDDRWQRRLSQLEQDQGHESAVPWIPYYRAAASVRLGRLEVAEENLLLVLDYLDRGDPYHQRALRRLVECYRNRGALERARRACVQGLEDYPEDGVLAALLPTLEPPPRSTAREVAVPVP